MELYFLRHGKAVECGTPGYVNDDRPLTKDGIAEMAVAAVGIRKIAGSFDLILSSPLDRAHHTARIVSDTFKKEGQPENKPQVCDELKPGSSAKNLFLYLRQHKNKDKVLIVGHEPDLSGVASFLLGAKPSSVELKKGGLCRIDVVDNFAKGEGLLIFSLPPKILSLLGKSK